ncbi:O-sialoglycoprotein endopeptidase [Anoxybacterium hadale]|uniref:O-sialoglycoprotein endopeptidase n=1 Tax=Anoxybacterium hadale TaxID=3408580 RepID=A0ACD1A8Q9_9FIRM|nr:O-sialoglycoprotein endopeptidase [Clostridiales bacterium]
MQNKDLILGIDTSNYTTSLAVTDISGEIKLDARKLLTVKQGERGLRQSHALFQHMENLPVLILKALESTDKHRIAAVAASSRPRPVEGSYMPVFKAGVNYGKVMAASLGVPFFEFSHQEGHLEAVKYNSPLTEVGDYLAYHLSGGTSELLKVSNGQINILGGSRDLSFGQVIDRIGVVLGMDFPCGKQLDQMAIDARDKLDAADNKKLHLLKKIPVSGLEINLSGLETQCRRHLENGADPEWLIYELFHHMGSCLAVLTEKAVTESGCSHVLFTGGVTASSFIRTELKTYFNDRLVFGRHIQIMFGDPALSSDNAVGISYLGGKALWLSNR